MRLKLIAAAVTIATLAMPATAMAGGGRGGGGGGAGSGDSGSGEHGASGPTSTGVLAFGAGYDRAGGSPQVRVLQRRLAVAGFPPGPADGLYGPRTAAAVFRFQAASGLVTDGIAGPRTEAALTSPVPSAYPGAGYELGGSRLVRHLQRLLIRAGYRPGRVDGVYGPHTEHAVRQFQAGHRLPIDGVARPQTFMALATHVQAAGGSRPATIPAPASPTTTVPVPSHAPAPVIARTGQPAGASPIAWLAILGVALAAAMFLIAALYTRRAAGRPRSEARSRGVDGHSVAAPNGHHGSGNDESLSGGVRELGSRATENGAGADEAFRVGVLCEEQNDLAGAEAAYRRADDQGHAAAASNLGVLLERRRDLAGAEAAYRRADERGDPNGSFNLAVLLEDQNDLTGAEAAYRRADERGPAEVADAARAALLTLRTAGGDSQARKRKDVRVG